MSPPGLAALIMPTTSPPVPDASLLISIQCDRDVPQLIHMSTFDIPVVIINDISSGLGCNHLADKILGWKSELKPYSVHINQPTMWSCNEAKSEFTQVRQRQWGVVWSCGTVLILSHSLLTRVHSSSSKREKNKQHLCHSVFSLLEVCYQIQSMPEWFPPPRRLFPPSRCN